MHRALLKLARLQVKGWIRRQFKGGSVRRTVLAIIACVMFAFWLLGGAIGSMAQAPRTTGEILSFLPVYLTAFAFLPIVFGSDDRAIAFSAAEIDFLFPGPFPRRHLVLFKMLKLSAGSLLGGFVFANVLHRWAGSFGACVAGGMLSLIFINLWATLVSLARDTVRERFYAAFRKATTVALLMAGAGVVWLIRRSDSPTMDQVKHLVDSTPARIVLAPATVFAHVFASRTLDEFGRWSLASLGLIGAALLLVLAMDKGYMEAAVAASQRRQNRLAGMAKGMALPTGPVRSLNLPALSILGPGRAIIKKQLITVFRTSNRWIFVLIVALGYGYVMSRMTAHDRNTPALIGMMPGVVILLMFLPQALRFDFRSDLDNIEFLKALPISARAIAAAELSVPSGMLSVLGWVIAGGLGVFMSLPPRTIVMAALAIVPLAVWVIGLENLIFLLMPTRLFSQNQASMVLSGRRMVMMLAKLGLFVVGGGAVFGVSFAAWELSHSAPAAFATGWATLCMVAGGLVLAVSWAFARFDVSADMPV